MTPLRHAPTLPEIIAAVSRITGVSEHTIQTGCQSTRAAREARILAWAVARRFPAHEFTAGEIAEEFGCNTSTIYAGVKAFDARHPGEDGARWIERVIWQIELGGQG